MPTNEELTKEKVFNFLNQGCISILVIILVIILFYFLFLALIYFKIIQLNFIL